MKPIVVKCISCNCIYTINDHTFCCPKCMISIIDNSDLRNKANNFIYLDGTPFGKKVER